MATFIDVHSHIDKLEGTPEEAVAKALAAGVQKIITIGTEPADHPVVIELAEKFYLIVRNIFEIWNDYKAIF
jgi:TatD DNase family protein